jgi:cytochrome oxidase assembly protein ShyY1
MAALVLCLILAVGFALLAQWQVGRTVIENSSNETWSQVKIVELESFAKPNQPFTFNEISTAGDETILTKVRIELTLNPAEAFLVGNRIQVNGDRGYWIVVPARSVDSQLFVAVGFVELESQAQDVLAEVKKLAVAQAFLPQTGRYLPSEAPNQSVGDDLYDSLSVPQLINRGSFIADPSYAGFLALTDDNVFGEIDGVQILTVGMSQMDSQLNWLSAFYAIEWTVFAGFAVFMWWRLLADSYMKQQTALLAD